MAFNPVSDGIRININPDFYGQVTRKMTRTEADNILQALVFDANSVSMLAESMTLDSLIDEYLPDGMVLDATTISTNMKMLNGRFTDGISRTLSRKLAPDLSISGTEVSKVKKSGLYASIAAIFTVSDGQTVSIIFHAPDGDPKVIAQNDTLIAFRFLLNKSDVTRHVIPKTISVGGIASLDQVSTNMAALIKANSGSFLSKQGQIAAQKKELEEKQAELSQINQAIAQAIQAGADAVTQANDADERISGLTSRIKKLEGSNAVLEEKIAKLKAAKPAENEGDTEAKTPEDPQTNWVSVKELRREVEHLERVYNYDRSSAIGFSEQKQNAEIMKRVADELRNMDAQRAKPEDRQSKVDILEKADQYVSDFPETEEDWEAQYISEEKIGAAESKPGSIRKLPKMGVWLVTGNNGDVSEFDNEAAAERESEVVRGITAPEPVAEIVPKSEPGQPEDPYADRIEALRTMPLDEYENAVDTLIAELETAGRLSEYEAILTEIDKSRDEELKAKVAGV